MSDKLDTVLKDWATKQEPDTAHLDELRAGIKEDAIRGRLPVISPLPHSIPLAAKLKYIAIGVAACLVLVLGFVIVSGPSSGNGTASVATLASIPPERLAAGQKLFGEMNRMFSDRLRWVAESNGDVGMGIESLSGGVGAEAVPVLVRVTVVSRKSGEDVWRPEWRTDVLLRGQDIVEVVPNRDSANKLALWVYPLTDGKIVVDGSISLDAPVRLSCKVDAVVQQGVPLELMSLKDGETEYRVFQTVTDLAGKRGA